MRRSLASVSRRVRTLCLDETAQEVDQIVSVLINPTQKRFFLISRETSLILSEMFS